MLCFGMPSGVVVSLPSEARGGEGVRAVRHQREDEVGPAVAGRGGRELHRLAARAHPDRVGERQPREAAAVGAAGHDHLLRVHVEERIVGDEPREVLEVVDLEVPRVELRLAGGTLVHAVDEAARGVGEDDVAAGREPGVVVVPPLAHGIEGGALPARPVARAAAVHHHHERVAAGRRGQRRDRDVDVERDVPGGRVRAGHHVRVRALRRQAREAVVLGRHEDRVGAPDVRREAAGGGNAVVAEHVAKARRGRQRRAARLEARRHLRVGGAEGAEGKDQGGEQRTGSVGSHPSRLPQRERRPEGQFAPGRWPSGSVPAVGRNG
jgi:hypothetical protein